MPRTRVEGTAGNDVLNEGPQASSDIFGLGGNDQIFLTRDDDLGGDNFVDAGAGHDQVLNRFEGGNEVLLGSGNDIYVADGFALGTGAFDTVHGGDGHDTIAVSTFHSDYFGDIGNDTFFSVGWKNSFHGGAGTDTMDYSLRDEDPTLGGSAVTVDLVQGLAFTGASRTEALVSIETVIGTGFADRILGSNAGNTLSGGNGNDQLSGNGGQDTLKGDQGNDQISGGSHADVLVGGRGADVLTGGTGGDRFDFDAAADSTSGARDQIRDFVRAQGDKIDLATIDANTAVAGDQSFTLVGSAAFGANPGQLRFSGGVLSGNTDNDAAAEFQISVAGLASMQAADFIL